MTEMTYKTAKFELFTTKTESYYYAIFNYSGAHSCLRHKEHETFNHWLKNDIVRNRSRSIVKHLGINRFA